MRFQLRRPRRKREKKKQAGVRQLRVNQGKFANKTIMQGKRRKTKRLAPKCRKIG